MDKTDKRKKIMASSLGFITIILFWLIFSVVIDNEIIFPGIDATLIFFGLLFTKGSTYLALLNTLGGIILILIVSFVSSFLLVVISLKFPTFKIFTTPILSLFKIVPIPALIILFLASYRQTFIPYILTFLVTLPFVYDGIYGAFISVNKDIIDDLRLISKLNLKIVFKVYLPLVRNHLITTLLQVLGLCLKIKVMTEFIAEAPNTIGYQLSYARATLAMDSVFAWSLILILVVVIIDYGLVSLLSKEE